MSNVTVKIKDDRTKIDELLKLADSPIDVEVAAGIFSNSHPVEAKRAIFNEFGTSIAPSRPFVLPTFEANKRGMQKYIVGALRKNKNPEDFLMDLAQDMADKIQSKIIGQRFKKLADSTIARKGHGVKLIDTGEMYDAVIARRLK